MRKLEKLTEKELKTKTQIIDYCQLQSIIGGSGTGWTYENYKATINNEFYEVYQDVVNGIESAIDDVSAFFSSREEAFSNLSWNAVEQGVVSWLNALASGTSSLAAPIFIIDSPALNPVGSGSDSELI